MPSRSIHDAVWSFFYLPFEFNLYLIVYIYVARNKNQNMDEMPEDSEGDMMLPQDPKRWWEETTGCVLCIF